MPRPLATPVRQAIAWRWRQGQDARTIADDLGLVARTVRRFLRRLRRDESDDLRPAYARADPDTADDPVYQAAVALRQAHPTWGAPLIRVLLGHDFPPDSLPSARTLQRWFVQEGLTPAPKGRRPRPDSRRAGHPHFEKGAARHRRNTHGAPSLRLGVRSR